MIYLEITILIIVVMGSPMLLTWFGEYLHSKLFIKKYRIRNKKIGFNKIFKLDELKNFNKVYANFLRKRKLEEIKRLKLIKIRDLK